MNIKDWIETMSRSGMVCTDYMRKISAVESRGDLFRVLCDANGGQWLLDLHAKGIPLPVDDFRREFANYLDGKKEVVYPQGYTSKFYCRHDGEIIADTTLVYLLECPTARVTVPGNNYPSLILSKGTVADITMGNGSRLNIEAYGDARWSITGDQTRVRVTRH